MDKKKNFFLPFLSNQKTRKKMLLKYISLPVFLLSFVVGLFFVFVMGPEMKTVHIYPSPETVGKFVFQDKAGSCFTFRAKTQGCPEDESKISAVPMQA